MLKEAGGGAIVNLSSSAGRFGYAFRTPYSAAKWGVIGLTQSLAKELGPHNIRVNAVLPGIVEGPRMTGVIEARAKQMNVSYEAMEKTYVDRVSLRRMVTAGDVAASVAYLLSPAGRNLSGFRSRSTATSRRCESARRRSRLRRPRSRRFARRSEDRPRLARQRRIPRSPARPIIPSARVRGSGTLCAGV